jgi:non-specific serine/threonine protein kinase
VQVSFERESARASGPPRAPASRWTVLPAARTGRTEVAAARLRRYAYIAGGFEARTGRSTAKVERYDLVARRSASAPRLPVALNHAALVARRGALYLLGGYQEPAGVTGGATSALWRLPRGAKAWTPLAPAPTARAALAVAASPRRLYAAGGSAGGAPLSTFEIYDFASGRWSAGPPLPVAREHVAGAVLDGDFYVLGGRVGAANLRTVERYRPTTRRWEQLPPLPVATSGLAAVTARGRVVVFGGESPAGTIGATAAFDPGTRSWTSLPPMRTPRHGLGGVAYGSVVYALAGGPRPGLHYSRAVERLGLR